MLNSTEHEISLGHKKRNTNNYRKTFFMLNLAEHELSMLIWVAHERSFEKLSYFKIYKQNKFHAHLSWAWKKGYNLGAWGRPFYKGDNLSDLQYAFLHSKPLLNGANYKRKLLILSF